MEYLKAKPEMVKMCQKLIEKHHEHLDGAKIAIICKDKASKKQGKTILATASLPSKKIRPLLDDDYHFIICVALDAWEVLEDKQRLALMDHELCHCHFSEDGDPIIVAHDLEEFGCIIVRHGLWRGDIDEERVSQAILFTQGVKVSAPNPAREA